MAVGELTPKQQRFVDEYLIDLNATQAAIRAGYSEKTAQAQGSRLLSNVMVAEAIAAAQVTRSERTRIDADWVLERLAAEATADVLDIYTEDGALKPLSEWPLIWRQGLVAGLESDEEYEDEVVDGEKVGRIVSGRLAKVKLSDRIKRIELIGKHINVQAFSERKELTGRMEVTDISDVERKQRLRAILRSGDGGAA